VSAAGVGPNFANTAASELIPAVNPAAIKPPEPGQSPKERKSMWKWIMKIPGLGKPSEEELAQPSEEGLAQPSEEGLAKTVHEIAKERQFKYSSSGRVFLSEGKEGYAEARQLLGSYAGRGFQEPKMYLEWLPDLRIRDTHELGWVSNGWTRIVVHVGKTYPKT